MRDLYQRKKGGVYWCEFYEPSGRRARRSTRCKDRVAAGLVRRRLEREAHDPNRQASHAAPCTVAKVLDHFVNGGCPEVADATLSMYLQKAGHLQRLLGELDVSEMQDVAVMQGYIKARRAEGAQTGTVHKEIVTMRQALYAALEAKHIAFDPRICFPRFKVKYVPKERWLTPDEFTALLRAFGPSDDPVYHQQGSPHRQMWLVVAVFTGGRDSEVDAVEWKDIDWRQGIIRIRGTKTGAADRKIPLQTTLAAVLKRSKRDAGPIVGEWSNVRRDLHAACARAGIAPCSPNDLRRTFATWLGNQGVAESATAKLLGHGSSRMVRKVYAQLEDGLLAREMAKLSGACTTGDPAAIPAVSAESLVTRASLGHLSDILTGAVLGPGIEPGTRGFSIRVASKKFAWLRAKNQLCAIGVPKLRRVS